MYEDELEDMIDDELYKRGISRDVPIVSREGKVSFVRDKQ